MMTQPFVNTAGLRFLPLLPSNALSHGYHVSEKTSPPPNSETAEGLFESPTSLGQSGVKGMHPLAGRGAAPHKNNQLHILQKKKDEKKH